MAVVYQTIIQFTQADGSVWAVPLELIEEIFTDDFYTDNGYAPTEGINYNRSELLCYADNIPWRDIVHRAWEVTPAPEGGPDYSWGWTHADKRVIRPGDEVSE